MVGQRSGFSVIDWPYMEGLRMDEAMHPLAILAVGMYGRLLPNQNGAPLRLVVPWKYGFKSIKSIVRISLVREQPKTTWESIAANEYGFYANVNPQVDHPRWSQARERRLPSGLFSPNVRDTQMLMATERGRSFIAAWIWEVLLMRYWYLRLAVFLGRWQCRPGGCTKPGSLPSDLTRARPWSIDWGWAPWYCCYSPWR